MSGKFRKFLSFTSDFGVGTQGIGLMHAVAMEICPEARLLDLRHGLPGFDVTDGAWTMEAVSCLPVGCHVCVVDPGVGTSRKPIIIKARRGDFLIGPDNGVLIPAAERFLGGIEKAVEITNGKYMRKPVSPVFHGRDVFTPAAAWLCKGTRLEDFGPGIERKDLADAPYGEAEVSKGLVEGEVIHLNHFGSIFINVKQSEFAKSGIKYGDKVSVETGGKRIKTRFLKTFGEVPEGKPVMFPDDYGRVEVAINMGDFSKRYGAGLRDALRVVKK